MTDYNADISAKLDTLTVGKVWAINPDRPDLEAFTEAIKARIDLRGDFLFSDDYKTFKRVKTFADEVYEMQGNGKIDWHSMIKAIHDKEQRELELKHPSKKQWR